MDIIFTKEKKWLQQWDEYIQNENVASHLLLSNWNKSFESYGFEYEICVALKNNVIIGGYVAVIAKVSVFKFYIVPFGPIISLKHFSNYNELISKVPLRANLYKCCYAHITLPFSSIDNPHTYKLKKHFLDFKSIKEGHFFKHVYSGYGINWKSVSEYSDEEQLINSFRPSVRRYIRSSQRKGLELQFLENEEEIKEAYDLCLLNAKNNGYSLRDWLSFKDTLITLIKEKKAKFLGAYFENTIKGASFIIKAANHYVYILGGTVKEKPDFLAGHFLHYAAIKLAFDEKLSGYNISLGGSKGVVDLKNSYADEQIYFENSKYHWVLKPFYFKLYLFFEKYLKKHKKSVAKILSMLKR